MSKHGAPTNGLTCSAAGLLGYKSACDLWLNERAGVLHITLDTTAQQERLELVP